MYLSFDHFCRFFHNVHFGFSLFLVEDHVADQEGVLTLDHLGASGIFDIGEFFQWDLGAGGCRNQEHGQCFRIITQFAGIAEAHGETLAAFDRLRQDHAADGCT